MVRYLRICCSTNCSCLFLGEPCSCHQQISFFACNTAPNSSRMMGFRNTELGTKIPGNVWPSFARCGKDQAPESYEHSSTWHWIFNVPIVSPACDQALELSFSGPPHHKYPWGQGNSWACMLAWEHRDEEMDTLCKRSLPPRCSQFQYWLYLPEGWFHFWYVSFGVTRKHCAKVLVLLQ